MSIGFRNHVVPRDLRVDADPPAAELISNRFGISFPYPGWLRANERKRNEHIRKLSKRVQRVSSESNCDPCKSIVTLDTGFQLLNLEVFHNRREC